MASNPLGILDKDLQDVGKENTISGVLQNFGNKLQDALKANLRESVAESGAITARSLEGSIIFDIKVLGTGYQFELKMNDYWEFVDQGVQGVGGVKKNGTRYFPKNTTSEFRFNQKKPPLSALEEWSYFQGVNPFVVQNSVFHKGTKATNFYSDVVDEELFDQLNKELAAAGAKEISITLKNTFNGNTA